MEAYFEQWPFKLFFKAHQGPPFRLVSLQCMDHTHASGFAHNLCKFSTINPPMRPLTALTDHEENRPYKRLEAICIVYSDAFLEDVGGKSGPKPREA